MRCSASWEKTGRRGLRIVRYFQEVYEPDSCISLYLESAIILVMPALRDQQKPSAKNMCFIACIPPFTKIAQTLTFPSTSLERTVSRN